ncbi:MAG: peptidase dimerization domain-containing protein, partial [Myxococcota bacterium]
EVTVFGATRELHSGHYGNWAPVPGTELAHLLASMKGRDGAVRVKGFYDSHTPITEADRKAIATAPPVDAQLREELALHETEASNAPLGERLLLPALTIRGLASGDVGAKSRNAIPERAVATLGFRLAKGDDPEHMLDLLEDHIRAEGFHVVYDEPSREVRRAHPRVAMVTRRKGYRAVRTDSGDSRVQPVIQALRAVEPKIILNPTMGGSLPLYLFEDRSSAPIVILPIANHDNNQHAPNENLRIGNLWYGMDAYAVFLTR